jgi:biopolymer transport protein ExbB
MMNRFVQTAAIIAAAFVMSWVLYTQVDIIRRGGPVMVPIVMCSIFSVAIVVDRLYYFLRLHQGKDTDRFFTELHRSVSHQQWSDAQALAEALGGPLGRVAMAGLGVREATAREIDEAMEEAAHDELPAVERHLRWLSTLAQVSTLLGLLGTVTGLVRAFQVIQAKSAGNAPVNPGDLAGGVWEALITTVAGLTVAIPTILAYNYFASRVHELQFQMEKAAGTVSGWRRQSHRSGKPTAA